MAVYDQESSFLSSLVEITGEEKEKREERTDALGKQREIPLSTSPPALPEGDESLERTEEVGEKAKIRKEGEFAIQGKKKEKLLLEYLLQPGEYKYPDFWFFQLWVSQDRIR